MQHFGRRVGLACIIATLTYALNVSTGVLPLGIRAESSLRQKIDAPVLRPVPPPPPPAPPGAVPVAAQPITDLWQEAPKHHVKALAASEYDRYGLNGKVKVLEAYEGRLTLELQGASGPKRLFTYDAQLKDGTHVLGLCVGAVTSTEAHGRQSSWGSVIEALAYVKVPLPSKCTGAEQSYVEFLDNGWTHYHFCPDDTDILMVLVPGLIGIAAAVLGLPRFDIKRAALYGAIAGLVVALALLLFRNADHSLDIWIPPGVLGGGSDWVLFGAQMEVNSIYMAGNWSCDGWRDYWASGCVQTDVTKWTSSAQTSYLDAVTRAPDNSLWHATQTTPGGSWSAFESVSCCFASPPAVTRNLDGRLDVIAVGGGNNLYEIHQNSDGIWSGYNYLGCCYQGTPAASVDARGRVVAVARGVDNAIHFLRQSTPGGSFGSDFSLGGVLDSNPTLIGNADSTLDVFARAGQNLWHNRQADADGGWQGWSFVGYPCCVIGNPQVSRNGDGRLEVFASGTSGSLFHQWQTSPGGGWNGTWYALGGPALSYDASIYPSYLGLVEVFGVDGGNSVWHVRQSSPGGAWTAWESLGCCVQGTLGVNQNIDGRMEFLAVAGPGGQLFRQAQTSPAGPFGGWQALGGSWQVP